MPGGTAHLPRVSPAGIYAVATISLAPNVDPEVALDLIFGPAKYRMAIGHAGLTPADADAIVATAMRALAS